MSTPLRGASFTALVAILAVAVVAGFASGSTGRGPHVIHIQTIQPHTRTLDFAPKGKSPGDLYVIDARIVAPNGHTTIGRLRGTQTAIKLEHGFETVEGMLTYELGAGNEIVVGGLSAYPLRGTGLVRGKSFVRPVLGGSGKYAGATGTVTSKQLAGGRYDQVFQLTY